MYFFHATLMAFNTQSDAFLLSAPPTCTLWPYRTHLAITTSSPASLGSGLLGTTAHHQTLDWGMAAISWPHGGAGALPMGTWGDGCRRLGQVGVKATEEPTRVGSAALEGWRATRRERKWAHGQRRSMLCPNILSFLILSLQNVHSLSRMCVLSFKEI